MEELAVEILGTGVEVQLSWPPAEANVDVRAATQRREAKRDLTVAAAEHEFQMRIDLQPGLDLGGRPSLKERPCLRWRC